MGAQYYEGTTTTETVTTTAPAVAYVDTAPSRANWGAIAAGVFCGFALLVLLSSLGAAVGVSAVAASDVGATERDLGLGGGIWAAGTWILVGLFAGYVVGRCARHRMFLPGISSMATWGVGIALFLGMLALGAGGMLGGMNAALGDDLRGVSGPDSVIRFGDRAVTLAWLFFGVQLLSLSATYVGARMGCREPAMVVT